MITLIAGGQYVIFGVLIPQAAIVHAQQNAEALGKMVRRATTLGVLILVLTAMPILFYVQPVLRLRVGRS